MIRLFFFSFFFLSPAVAQSTLPSGLSATLHDILLEEQPGGEVWMVIRYIAPQLSHQDYSYEVVSDDLLHLCETRGISVVNESNAVATQINVVLMDRAVERGIVSPQATQYIGAYTPIEGKCVWSDF